jgi:DNA-binding MarR family transcriptional regulator
VTGAARSRHHDATPAPSQTAGHGDGYACARAWAALTAAHALVAERLSAELARGCGIGISDFEILLRLERVPPPGLRLGELLPAVRLTQPSLSRAVARLGRHGWVSKAGAIGDRRGVTVTITSSGRRLLRRAVPVHTRIIREILLDPLTAAEQDLLARALSRVAES